MHQHMNTPPPPPPLLHNSVYGMTGSRCGTTAESHARCILWERTMLLLSIWQREGLQLEHLSPLSCKRHNKSTHNGDLCVCFCTDECDWKGRARKCASVWFWEVSRRIVGQMAGGCSISFSSERLYKQHLWHKHLKGNEPDSWLRRLSVCSSALQQLNPGYHKTYHCSLYHSVGWTSLQSRRSSHLIFKLYW